MTRSDRILPIIIAIVAVVASLIFWQALKMREHAGIKQEVRLKAEAVKDDVKDNMTSRVSSLTSMAIRFERNAGLQKKNLEFEAFLYHKRNPSSQALGILDPELNTVWKTQFDGTPFEPSADRRWKEAIERAGLSGKAELSHVSLLPGGERSFIACVPLYGKGVFNGYIIEIFKSQSVLGDILQTSHFDLEGYSVEILDGDEPLYSNGQAGLSKWSHEDLLRFYGTEWKVRLAPGPEYFSRSVSILPEIILGFGILLGVMLAVAVYFSENATESRKSLEGANEKLKTEIEERNKAEEKVYRLNRLYSVLSKINEAIIRTRDPKKLYEEACKIAVEDGDFRMAWVGMVDPDTLLVKPIASAGAEKGYLENIRISVADTVEGHGPTGSAIREGRYFICNDFESDPKVAPWRDEALKRGYRSSAAFPLHVDTWVAGVLNLYAKEPHFFDEEEIKLLESLSADISFAIENLNIEERRKAAEEELRKYRDHLEELVEARTEELKAVNKELEAFTYSASHDLQEPLRIVAGYVQLLSKRYKGKLDADADEFIAFAVDGATRMQKLISDLLTYSRVGKIKELEPVDAEEVFQRALANLKASITESGALVTHDQLPTVTANFVGLGQLFMNLIGNGIKYRGAKPPRIHVSAKQVAGDWVFSIADNGIGIEPKYFEKIFEIFQRLHGKTEYPGTGIGLSICKKVVDNLGGRLWVESEPGAGSTFYFTIPIKRGV